MLRYRLVAALVGWLVLVPFRAFAQDQTPGYGPPSSQANGLAAGVPETLRVRDLNNSWQVFRLSGSGSEGNGLIDVYLVISGERPTQNTFYTQGKSVLIGDQSFLVAYHLPVDLATLKLPARRESDLASPLPPDTTLTLCLIDIRSIGVINDLHTYSVAPAPANHDIVMQAETLGNMKQLALAMLMYSRDHDERFPPMKTPLEFRKALLPYAKTEAIFTDPKNGAAFLPNPFLSRKSLAEIDLPASTVAVWDPAPADHGRIYVAFADGHVKVVAPDEWSALKKASKIP